MNYEEVLHFFFTECPEMVKKMGNSDHHYDFNNLNPYHLEGTVLTHNLMVLKEAERRKVAKIIMLACLFHDFGKPSCRGINHEKKRINFIGHEGASAFISIEYMHKLNLDKETMIHLIRLIALHTDPFKINSKNYKKFLERYSQEKELLKDLLILGECDSNGRFSAEHVNPSQEEKEKNQKLIESILKHKNEAPKKKGINRIILTVGLPCSGKSTWATNFQKQNPNFTIVSRDTIIQDKYPNLSYNDAYDQMDPKEINKILFDTLNDLKKRDKDIIVDMTHMNRKSRKKSLNGVKKDTIVEAKVFLPTMSEIYKRNQERKKEGKYIHQEAYDCMIKSFYPPMNDEFDDIEYMVVGNFGLQKN